MNLTQLTTWIPVEERLPEYSEYFVVATDGVVVEALFDGEKWLDEDSNVIPVTHWMPIAKHPSELAEELQSAEAYHPTTLAGRMILSAAQELAAENACLREDVNTLREAVEWALFGEVEFPVCDAGSALRAIELMNEKFAAALAATAGLEGGK